MEKIYQWRCYNNKTNHIIFTDPSGKPSVLCKSYCDKYPGPKWSPVNSEASPCYRCVAIERRNRAIINLPGSANPESSFVINYEDRQIKST